MSNGDDATGSLVVVRHARTDAVTADIFTGWIDAPLSDEGRDQAQCCAEGLSGDGPAPDLIVTSQLRRAFETAEIIARGTGASPVERAWQLNERHYGSAQGRPRSAVRADLGDAAYGVMHRSWDGKAPPGPSQQSGYQELDPRPYGICAESLADVDCRVTSYLRARVAPALRQGARVVVVSHSNVIRAIVACVESVARGDVDGIEIAMAQPRVYAASAVLDTLANRTDLLWDCPRVPRTRPP